jgi:hypothetical protein
LGDLRSFVVKVYRRNAAGMAGTVQDVRTGRTMPFQTQEELWQAVRDPSSVSESRSSHARVKTMPAAGGQTPKPNEEREK